MERWDRIGRGAAYGAALALTPYLLIKVSWVVGSLLGLIPVGDGFGLAGWVVLNLVTVGMAGIGIPPALALVRPWGMRIPGWLVVFCGWAGSGFLLNAAATLASAVMLRRLAALHGGGAAAGAGPLIGLPPRGPAG